MDDILRWDPRSVTYFYGWVRDMWQFVTGKGSKWPKIAWRALWAALG